MKKRETESSSNALPTNITVMKEKWDKLVEAMEKAGNTKEVEPPATEEALRETEAR